MWAGMMLVHHCDTSFTPGVEGVGRMLVHHCDTSFNPGVKDVGSHTAQDGSVMCVVDTLSTLS